MSHYNLFLIEREKLTQPFLNSLRGFIEEASKHNYGEMTVNQYLYAIAQGRMQLWICGSVENVLGVGVTQLCEYSDGNKSIRILLYSQNSFPSYIENYRSFEEWCLKFGANEVEFWGREGFHRAMKPLGFHTKYVVMRKKLGGSQ